MFGHDKHDDDDEAVVNPSTTPVNEALMGVNDDDDNAAVDDVPVGPVSADEPEEDNTQDIPADDDSSDEPDVPNVATPANRDESTQDDTNSNDLLDIKRHALQDLSPLLGHLDQSPEERFKTTMMMIQASDNQALVADAYEAAKGIEDEKVRAQALLDIVNEINYFTQAKND